jgi:hypothetical protein
MSPLLSTCIYASVDCVPGIPHPKESREDFLRRVKAEEARDEKIRRTDARRKAAQARPPKQVNVDHLPHTWTPGRMAAEMEKRKAERPQGIRPGIRFSTPPPARPKPTKEELVALFAEKERNAKK